MLQRIIFPLLLIGVATSGWGQTKEQAPASAPLLPHEQEMTIAESAAPASIAKSASIYVLEAAGYVKARDGSNGFTCLIERDGPLDFEPICYDREGSETLLAAVLRRGELRRQGRTEAEIESDIGAGYASGKYRAPRRAGIAYMLSAENRIYSEKTKTTRPLPPHVMVYAPYLKNSDFGFTADSANKLPYVVQEGRPDAFIIIHAPKAQESEKHAQ